MRFTFSTFVVLALTALTSHALVINGYNAAQFNRFTTDSFPSAPVENSNLLSGIVTGVNLDFSGVGWSTSDLRQGITMITPQHFIAANHFRPSGQVDFLNQDGVLKSYTIDGSGYQTLTTSPGQTADLVIGKLTTSILGSDNITFYPVPDSTLTTPDYIDRGVIVYGRGATSGDRSPRVGYNHIEQLALVSDTGTDETLVAVTEQGNVTGETQGQTGDSGSPSFVVFDGQLTAVGTHFAIGTIGDNPATFDSFLPAYFSQINSIVTGDGETLTQQALGADFTVLVPEVSHFAALSGLAAIALITIKRRRLL
ncbi:hypothetical protein [Rubellicoccus peritrichatus]|uniref:Peptidase S1 domain-containing protein n=1 Tax=Rubellicoccus peritrichatus TaxID=3080537 RepID=A0AAQ3QWR4_9BACT|nr:hypothetical protein [Puniceicoccus sp. CR14]WOO42167.1 hypothetical protein RZN69_03635 [Puniceicoccus sp. CR14]